MALTFTAQVLRKYFPTLSGSFVNPYHNAVLQMRGVMRRISRWSFIATKVRVEFEDGPVFFVVPRGATLAQVSENLDEIGKRHGGQPLAIEVLFKAHNERAKSPLPRPIART